MRYILLIFALFLGACSVKNYEHTSAKIFIIQSPKLKFADLGYLRHSDESLELELFVAGRVIEKITLNHLVCTSEGCMSKSSFNEDYLSAYYPDDILQNILLGNPIYEGKSRVQTQEGFEQSIQTHDVQIMYKVYFHGIEFKDKKNKIIIKIKNTQE